jgi:NADH-quinone oxidoreductase subunit L
VPSLGDWIAIGGLHVPMRLLIDRLSLLMMLVVTGIGALIHIYSLGYMARDPERVRYFSYLNLFTFFMLLLVTAGSLPLMFVGWEGVGLCSYLLIGFWFKRPSAAAAGFKAFLVNRIGDAGLLLGILLAWGMFGTVDIVRLAEAPSGGGIVRMGLLPIADAAPAELLGTFGPLTAMALLFFVGACGKSAQVPLHVWLPDAMEGPTPVSALIHAATMVTAGVYLVARLSPLYVKAPTALAVVAAVGLVTALMAGTVALVQTDIKRVLAYSTVSQLGFMFLACGVGCFGAAIFHLFTHAFFKALLFLGAGAVIHALGGEQDMRRMGGLRRGLPWTFWTFVAGAAAIAGVPLLSGYMSKEAILTGTLAAGHPWLTALALVAAALTAVYMTRLVSLTFFGESRGTDETRAHIHDAPWVMRVPLVLLALGALGAGYVGVPGLIAPALASGLPEKAAHAMWLTPLAIALALAAIVATAYLYLEFAEVVARLRARLAIVARVLEAKWGFDLAFDWVARRLVVDGSTALLWRRVDTGLIDAAVNGTAHLVDALAARTRGLQTGLVRQYALVLFGGTVLLLTYLVWR